MLASLVPLVANSPLRAYPVPDSWHRIMKDTEEDDRASHLVPKLDFENERSLCGGFSRPGLRSAAPGQSHTGEGAGGGEQYEAGEAGGRHLFADGDLDAVDSRSLRAVIIGAFVGSTVRYL